MKESLQPQPPQILQGRCETIADSLHKALAGTSFVPLAASEVRQRLVELTAQAIALLFAEPFERCQAEAIGASLVSLHYVSPEGLGELQEVLARTLVEGLPAEQVVALQPRLAALLGGVAAGFCRQAREVILAEQEQIRHALIAARQQAEEALRESERVARALLDAPAESAVLMEPDGTVIASNRAAADSLNVHPDELVGRCIFDYVPADVAEFRKAHSDQVVRSGQSLRFEDRRGARYFDHNVHPVFDAQGEKVVRLAIIVHDITEHKRAEKELLEQAERLRLLHEIDGAVLDAQSPDEIGRAVVERLRRVIPCFGAGVALFDSEARVGTLLFAGTDSTATVPAGTRFSLDEIVGIEEALEALQRGEICRTERILMLGRAAPELRTLHEEGLHTALIVPLIARETLIGFLGLGMSKSNDLAKDQLQTIRQLADSLAIAIQQAQLFQSIKQQGEQLGALAARLSEVEEAERQRLARELHDQVGQNLTALNINLNVVQTHMPEETPEFVRSRLENSLALLEETTERVRHVMADLRPPMLDDFGLLPALQWCSIRFSSQTGIPVIVQGEEPAPRLPALTENALFRIAQEALTNVAKHARATQVTVTLTTDDDSVRLVITDDGVGFDPTQLRDPGGRRGWGVLTMTERAEAVGGHFQIKSRPHQGTQLVAEIAR